MTNKYEVKVSIGGAAGMINRIKSLRLACIYVNPLSGDAQSMMGLKEAKETVERMVCDGYVTMHLTDHQARNLVAAGFEVRAHNNFPFVSTEIGINKIFRSNDGQKIAAIKDLRQATGLGLREAKDLIDRMWNTNSAVEVKISKLGALSLTEKGFTILGEFASVAAEAADHFETGLFEI